MTENNTNENYIEDKCFVVYKHTSPNGKIYVGITKQELEKRWANGNGYKNCSYFYNAIQKYGWENFDHEILYENLSEKEACDIEKKLIDDLDLLNPEKGYNLKTGGKYAKLSERSRQKISKSLIGNTYRLGVPHTEEVKQKMRESRKGKNSPLFGKHLSEETKKKISDAKKGISLSDEHKKKLSKLRQGEKNGFYGKHHSEKTKKKLSQINSGKMHTEEAKRKMSKARKGKKFSEEHKKNLGDSRKKPVVQLTLSGEFVREWDGCIDVKLELGILHINDVCNGNRKSAGGFRWMWREDYYGTK